MSTKYDSDPHLFNATFDNAKLKDKLLNQREQKSTVATGRVQRYRPGMVPSYVERKEEEQKNVAEEESHPANVEVVIQKKHDARLERIKAMQEQSRKVSHRTHTEAELIFDDDDDDDALAISIHKKENSVEPIKAVNDVNSIQHRRQLISRALDDEEEELEKVDDIHETKEIKQDKEDSDEYEDEYEYEEYSSEDENNSLVNRKTIEDPEVIAQREKEVEEEEEVKKQKRYEETQRLIIEENLREIEENDTKDKNIDPNTLKEIPDDTDDLLNEDEIQAWKEREFNRIMRDRLKEEERQKEEEEKKRRNKMSDADIIKENERLMNEGIRYKKEEHTRGTFLQKYYHKGIFYLDEESIQSKDDVRNRDAHAPTERDRVDKKLLPRVMQVRDFGKKSQSKWTYLRNEDTTKNKDWLQEIQERNTESKFKHAGNK